jgi:large subunit ribosomal protein L1
MGKVSKRFAEAKKLVDATKQYSLAQACEILAKFPKTKFDETVEAAIKLGVDPRKAEENVRGTVALPHGTGKNLRVAAFCKGDKQKEAQEAGADFVGGDDLVAKVQEGWLDFDAVVATPDMMVGIGKIGKILGPRGLMPNPKIGTVTPNIANAVKAIKAGQVEFRVEKAGIVHVGAGKVSFGPKKIEENLASLIDSIVKAKPKAAKGVYLEAIHVSTTMGPGLAIDPSPYRQV